jgi:hypothetical protein
MARESHRSAFANVLALRPVNSWPRWLCFDHQWIVVARLDDLVCERCARCEKDRQWHLPIHRDAP